MEQLPDEIIRKILQSLDTDDPCQEKPPLNQSIRTMSLCSTHLRRIALPMLFHTVTVSTMSQLDNLLSILLASPDYCKLVRRLKIQERVETKRRRKRLGTLFDAGLRELADALG
ncbi:hypothetical protein CPB86DRAFT_782029 [Serendipita vermifera]|nr:hypothetical protein CPB86DRAFT_782029 [Serendipita vermifera]